jgi:hypothetical protein
MLEHIVMMITYVSCSVARGGPQPATGPPAGLPPHAMSCTISDVDKAAGQLEWREPETLQCARPPREQQPAHRRLLEGQLQFHEMATRRPTGKHLGPGRELVDLAHRRQKVKTDGAHPGEQTRTRMISSCEACKDDSGSQPESRPAGGGAAAAGAGVPVTVT